MSDAQPPPLKLSTDWVRVPAAAVRVVWKCENCEKTLRLPVMTAVMYGDDIGCPSCQDTMSFQHVELGVGGD